MKNKVRLKAISVFSFLLVLVFFTLSLTMASFADGTSAPETSPADVVKIDASIVTLIFLAAAAIGGAFGYWIVRKK